MLCANKPLGGRNISISRRSVFFSSHPRLSPSLSLCDSFLQPSSAADREVLLALYRSTGGADWKNKRKWNTNAPLSKWNGVTVNDQGRVVELDLHDNNLRGTAAVCRILRQELSRDAVDLTQGLYGRWQSPCIELKLTACHNVVCLVLYIGSRMLHMIYSS